MSRAQMILEKRKELIDKQEYLRDILSAAWGQDVSIFIFDDSGYASEESDFEIMVSLEDEIYQEVIVCVTQKGIRLPAPVPFPGGLGFLMKLADNLEQLLGCRAGYVDRNGLKSWYPETYRHRFPNEESTQDA